MKKFIYLLAIIIFSLSLTFGLSSCIIVDSSGTGGSNNSGGNTDNPDDGNTDNPGGGNTDNPGGGNTDNPGGGNTDNPGGGNTDNPGGGNTDNPGGGNTDNPGGGNTDNPGGESTEKPNLIYNSNSELYVIRGEGVTDELVFNLQISVDSMRESGENFAKFGTAATPVQKHEIVIGDTDRPISVTAKSHLDRINKLQKTDLAYLIYSDGSSIAIVFDNDDRGVTAELAVQYFLDNYVLEELIAPRGDLYKYSYDIIEDHYRVLDNEYRTEQWEALRKVLDEDFADDFVTAMQQLYSIYSSDVIVWLANLYEPNICICYGLYGEERCDGTATPYCGTAGFYYSNSGRDTMRYLPDLESTSQALGFLDSSGTGYMFGNKYKNWLPEDIKMKLGLYAQAMQDENGFFYHPQWGKDFIENNNKDSRRARDLGHAQTLLSLAGLEPFYTTPTGVQGSTDTEVSAKLTSPFGTSTVMAVSKVILVNDNQNYAAHLESAKTFKEYLESYDIKHNSYSVGNRIGSQISQIKARDKVIRTEDDPTPLMDELMDYLIKNQNPETGCWNWNYKETGEPHTGDQLYESVNGLLKIVNDFTQAGRIMPYAKEAAFTAMEAIIDPKPIDAVTSLYNTWYAIGWVIENLRTCGGIEDDEQADEIVDALKKMAVKGIDASRVKIAVFKKDDGSFSYGPEYSAQTSQGCQVALPKSVEGDVNGCTISVNGIKNHIFKALELESYKPILFGEAERLTFLNIIENADSVIKNEVQLSGEPITFDDEDIGNPSEELTLELGDGSANVAADPKRSDNNVVKIVSHAGSGDYVTVPNQSNSSIDTTYVFESEFMLESSSIQDDSYFIQFFMGQKNYTCYFFTFTLRDGKVIVKEHSSSSYSTAVEEELGAVGNLGEWFKIKVEYYYAESMDDVRIKFYYDDNLSDEEDMKLLAVTDNFFDSTGNKYLIGQADPCRYFNYTRFYMMKDTEAVLYMDNCMVYKSQTAYEPATDADNQPPINIDPPDSPEKKYDFEDGAIPADMTLGEGTGISVKDKALSITDKGSLSVPVNIREMGSRCVSISFDITPALAQTDTTVLRLVGIDGDVEMLGINVAVREDTDGKYLTFVEYDSKAEGSELSTVRIPFEKTTGVRLDYFHKEDKIIIYVDGDFVAATGVLYPNGIKRTMDIFRLDSLAGGIDVSVDNLKVEKNTSLFTSAVRPTVPSNPYEFNNDDGLSDKKGNVTVADGILSLNSKSAQSSVSFNVHKRANLQNTLKFSADITATGATADGEIQRLLFTDSENNIIFALALVRDGNTVNICQVSAGGTVAAPIYSYDYGKTFKLTVEIFQNNRMVHITENDTVKAKTSVFYTPENVLLDCVKATLVSSDVKSIVTYDNLIFESYYAAYNKTDISSTVQPDERLSDKLHFEFSNSGKLPTGNLDLGYLKTPKAALRIEQLINTLMKDNDNPNGMWSNVVAMDTGAGNNDSLMILANEPMTTYSCVTFESDVKLNPVSTGAFFQLFLSDKSRNNKIIMVQISCDKDGKVSFAEMSNNSSKDGIVENALASTVKVDEWFKLRIEFYKGSRDNVRLKYFINDTLVAVSDNFYGSQVSGATPNSLLECIQLMSLSSADGTVYLDNISLKGSSATCTDNVTVQNHPAK